MYAKPLIFISLIVFPGITQAAVVINEIAWMGSSDSANDEWIELYNDGNSSVSLDGWRLDDGMNLEVELAGAVGAGQYAVLERTDDDSAPGSAFLIYTGALTNSGATLTLRNASDDIEDRVSGGESWENIGGDNTTKETAQLTSGGWVTGLATPGSKNSEPTTSPDDEGNNTDEEEKVEEYDEDDASKTVQLVLPDVELEIEIDSLDLMYVNQPVSFKAESDGISKLLLDSIQYQWNFGDAVTDAGETVRHVYRYPGEYVVTVYGSYAYHEQVARKTIKVLPVHFSLSKNQKGDIQIHNDAPFEIDISGYVLSGHNQFVLPERTILLPRATLTVPKERVIQRGSALVALYDQAEVLVASNYTDFTPTRVKNNEDNSSLTIANTPAPTVSTVAVEPLIQPPNFVFPEETSESSQEEVMVLGNTASSQSAALMAAQPPISTEQWPYLGLLGILILGLIGVYTKQNTNQQG